MVRSTLKGGLGPSLPRPHPSIMGGESSGSVAVVTAGDGWSRPRLPRNSSTSCPFEKLRRPRHKHPQRRHAAAATAATQVSRQRICRGARTWAASSPLATSRLSEHHQVTRQVSYRSPPFSHDRMNRGRQTLARQGSPTPSQIDLLLGPGRAHRGTVRGTPLRCFITRM